MKISGEREQLKIPDLHHRIVRSHLHVGVTSPSGLELQDFDSNHVLRILIDTYGVFVQPLHTNSILHAMDMYRIYYVDVEVMRFIFRWKVCRGKAEAKLSQGG